MSLEKGFTNCIIVSVMAFLLITACISDISPSSDVNNNQSSSTETLLSADLIGLPLSEPGPYSVGIRRNINFVDTSRNNREVYLTIWYPALKSDESASEPISDAQADISSAPYPVILSSSKVGFIFAKQLVSYGFVYVGINGIDTYMHFDQKAFDQPLDIIFALDQVSVTPPAGLEVMLDTQKAGTLGYSFDGTNSLFLSGARVDPEYYLSYCVQASGMEPPLEYSYLNYYCNLSPKWNELSDYIGMDVTKSEDGLWQPITDERIRAVMPMAADGAWFFGEKGLAAANRAVLMIQASKDSQYQPAEGAFIFEHLGSKDKTMVSFLGQQHMMIYDQIQIDRMRHFTVAFFSHQLQGKADMAYYYSQEFIEQFGDLAYGFYPEE